jgi:hypothetical protein
MNIAGREKVEDCFDGSSVFTYTFNESWNREEILKLRGLGEVDYFPDFPRPFFRLHCKNGLQVKGVEGDTQCRVIYPSEKKEVIMENFEKGYSSTTSM